jgi:hypothetical protein
MENSEKKYTGLEVNLVDLIFKRLNLTAEYNVSPNTMDAYYPLFVQTIDKIEPGSSDIAIGVLPLHSSIIGIAEATIPYFYITVSWGVPCPKQPSLWKSIFKIFGSLVGACFSAVEILAVIIMWLLTKHETQLNVRESANCMTKV